MIIVPAFLSLQAQLADYVLTRDPERDADKAARLQAATEIASRAHTLMPPDALVQLRQAEALCDFAPYIRALIGLMADQLEDKRSAASLHRTPAGIKPHSRNMGAPVRPDAPAPSGDFWWKKD